MQRFFTHYWENQTCDDQEAEGYEGDPLDHTASNQFSKRGVAIGDHVYVVTIRRGRAYLVGRMTVGQIIYSFDEARRVLGPNVWEAEEHLIARKGAGTPMRFQNELSLRVARQLRFETVRGEVGLKFRGLSRLDSQTLRGVRRLSGESARLLDSQLG